MRFCHTKRYAFFPHKMFWCFKCNFTESMDWLSFIKTYTVKNYDFEVAGDSQNFLQGMYFFTANASDLLEKHKGLFVLSAWSGYQFWKCYFVPISSLKFKKQDSTCLSSLLFKKTDIWHSKQQIEIYFP